MEAEIEKSRESIFNGYVFDVYKLTVETQDGSLAPREIIEHNGGACILAINENNEIYFVEQFRTAANQFMLELPAGKLNLGEDPKLCAIRELEEEAGLIANSVELLTEFFPTPGYSDEKIYVYYTDDFKIGEQNLDEGEFLEVYKYTLDEAVQMIFNGKIADAKTIVGILMAAGRRNK